jgi:transcriptional regulator with XRE-family HTH domain
MAKINRHSMNSAKENKSDLAKRIGMRLKELRKTMGLTLKRLSEETKLSPPLFSRIENGLIMPSIPTLQAIANVLKVDIESFFRREEGKEYVINPVGERPTVQSKRGPHLIELLAEGMQNSFMEPVLITFAPKNREDKIELTAHDGQEFGYVLEGKVELTLGKEKFILKKGDASYWNGSIPHKGVSLSKKPAKALNVHFAPGRRTPL